MELYVYACEQHIIIGLGGSIDLSFPVAFNYIISTFVYVKYFFRKYDIECHINDKQLVCIMN